MYRFFRWYNQNRIQVLIVIAVAIICFVILQIVNSLVAENNAKQRNILSSQNTYVDKTTNPSPTNTSILTGEKIKDSQDTINKDLIEQFVEYCNNDQIQEAYDMLSDECKELLYPNINVFNQAYIKSIFYIDRMYSLQNWYIGTDIYTYYIKYTEDVLATGNVNSSENKGDYITIVNQDDKYYLNISSFIARQKENKTMSNNNVAITVNWIDMYMDYTTFNIKVKNNTEKTICLDTKEDTSSTYIYDYNQVKYTSFLNENPIEQLVIKKQQTSNLNIKFNKLYNQSRILKGISFQDIVLNYDEYMAKTEEKEKISINISI